MLPALRLLACLLLVLAAGAGHAQDASFTHEDVQADAKRYETYLKSHWQPGARQGRDLRIEGSRLLAAGKDHRAASRAFAQAAVFDPNDAEAWFGLARALLAITPDQSSERYDLPVNASGAAWNAYKRAQSPAAKGAALFVLHEAFKRRSYWRPAIDALKSSLSLVDDTQVRETHDALVAQHGFRILEYKVDADASQPRLCIQFSERLAPGQVEWAKYLKIDGKDPLSVSAEARQICLDGLAHGKRYEVQVREGLPSATGEKLLNESWFPPLEKAGEALARVVTSGPDEDMEQIEFVTLHAISCAQKSVRVVTPYFLPPDPLTMALGLAALRGIKVDIVLPDHSNHALLDWARRIPLRPLIEAGCRVWLTARPLRVLAPTHQRREGTLVDWKVRPGVRRRLSDR